MTEVRIEYMLSVCLYVDLELAKSELPYLWQESDGDEDYFEQLVDDYLKVIVHEVPQRKQAGTLPRYVTAAYIREHG